MRGAEEVREEAGRRGRGRVSGGRAREGGKRGRDRPWSPWIASALPQVDEVSPGRHDSAVMVWLRT